MPIDFNPDLEIITVQVPANPSVITIKTPGPGGPQGPAGPAGPAAALTIGTVTTGAAGSNVIAGIRGIAPNQILDLTIPRGNTGANGPANTLTIGTVTTTGPGTNATATVTGAAPNQTLSFTIPQGSAGPPGPANTLSIGTVTTGAAGSGASASVSGAAPNQTLSLTIPQGLQGIQGATGPTGPANSLTIGTVTTGTAGSNAAASITGTAPNQTLSLTIPAGSTGPANTLTIGTVTTGAAGTNAVATITGTAPNQTLNLTIPTGQQGPAGAGAPDATTIAKGSVMLAGDLGGTADLPKVLSGANHTHTLAQVPGALNKAGDTMTGTLNLADMNSLGVSTLNNAVIFPNFGNPLQDPFPRMYHDLAAFNRGLGAPVFETSNGTTWTTGTADAKLFANKEAQAVTVVDGTTTKAARWTWTYGGWGGLRWLIIGHTYQAVGPMKTILVESSADGITWTTRHVSSYNNVTMPVWHAMSDPGGDTRIRLTITWTSGGAISLSTIRFLTSRWGDQGAGSENEIPYTWDEFRQITAPRFFSSSTPPITSAELTRKDYVDTADLTKANNSVTITAGTGLTGGGDLTASRTLAVSYGTTAGTAVQGNDIRVVADGVATQASIRTLGTGAQQAAAGNHAHASTEITDSTAIGRSVLTAVDAPTARTALGAGTSNLVIGTAAGTAAAGNDSRLSDARTPTAHAATHATGGSDPITVAAIGAAAATHTHVATAISDSTAIGRSVLTAVDAPTARAAIGAGTSSLVIGTVSGTAKDGAYQPTSANIADATTVGRSLITAVDATSARTTIGAAASVHTHPVTDFTATGTRDTTTFLRGDNVWAVPPGAGTVSDATTTTKGVIQLAGDLGGTAASPLVLNKASSGIVITAGTGLTGGGDLTASRSLSVSYGSTAGTAVQGNDIRVTADQAATQASIRTIGTGALQAAAGNHTHIATAITDSTTVGRSLLTAADAPTARTAIGAGTSNLAIGTTSTTAKAGDYQPSAANITATGRRNVNTALVGSNIWSPFVGTNEYYNVDQNMLRMFRLMIANARAGTAIRRPIYMLGASVDTGVGSNGAQGSYGIIAMRSLWNNLVGRQDGTGWVPAFNNAADTRWTHGFNGATTLNYVYKTSSASGQTETFVSDVAGTVVEVALLGDSGSFTISIDGAAQTVSGANGAAGTVNKLTYSGLTNKRHTIVVTATSATVVKLLAIRVGSDKGSPEFHGMAISGGTSAQMKGTGGTVGSPGWLLTRLGLVSGIVIIGCDVWFNDGGTATNTATTKAAVAQTIADAQAAGHQVMLTFPHQPNPGTGGTPAADWAGWQTEAYNLADQYNVPLLDMTTRWKDYATASSYGYMFDNVHATALGYEDWALALSGMFMEAMGSSYGVRTATQPVRVNFPSATVSSDWDVNTFGPVMVTRQADGMVVVSGLMKIIGALGAGNYGTTLFQVPPEYAPARAELFYVPSGQTASVRLDIQTTGNVTLQDGSLGAGSFLGIHLSYHPNNLP